SSRYGTPPLQRFTAATMEQPHSPSHLSVCVKYLPPVYSFLFSSPCAQQFYLPTRYLTLTSSITTRGMCVCVCVCVCSLCFDGCMYIDVRFYVCVHVRTGVYVCVRVCVFIHSLVCACVFVLVV